MLHTEIVGGLAWLWTLLPAPVAHPNISRNKAQCKWLVRGLRRTLCHLWGVVNQWGGGGGGGGELLSCWSCLLRGIIHSDTRSNARENGNGCPALCRLLFLLCGALFPPFLPVPSGIPVSISLVRDGFFLALQNHETNLDNSPPPPPPPPPPGPPRQSLCKDQPRCSFTPNQVFQCCNVPCIQSRCPFFTPDLLVIP